jgi:hypothetical protein
MEQQRYVQVVRKERKTKDNLVIYLPLALYRYSGTNIVLIAFKNDFFHPFTSYPFILCISNNIVCIIYVFWILHTGTSKCISSPYEDSHYVDTILFMSDTRTHTGTNKY